jgi:hypothetical protein
MTAIFSCELMCDRGHKHVGWGVGKGRVFGTIAGMQRWIAAACLGLLACGDLPDEILDGPDAAPQPPIIQVAYGGTYTVAGTWDLSRPLGADGVGGVVADLVIDQIVALAGVPSALEDEARTMVADAIRQPIVDHVNGVVPTELLATDPTMIALAAILADVEHGGTLSLSPGADPDFCSGTDTVTSLRVQHQATAIDVSMTELLDGAVSVAGGFSGSATASDRLTLSAHALELRYGDLIAIVARDALGLDAYALGDQAMQALDCAALIDVVTGGDTSYDLSVGGQDFSVPVTMLTPACADLRADLATDALAMVRPDAGITLGGPVQVTGSTVTSQPGYGGVITSLPGPVQPQVTATFSGTR